MKIIDCFTFYNEFKLLNYRLSILYPIVDYFIIVEGTKTQIGKPKPLFFKENREQFKPFLDKIIHIVDDELIDYDDIKGDNAWINEIHQRNHIHKGIEQLDMNDNDLIMISDCDEIPDIDYVKSLRNKNNTFDIVALEQVNHIYNLTCLTVHKLTVHKIIRYGYYKNNPRPNDYRHKHNMPIIPNGGWHLTYFNNAELISNKIKSIVEQEFNNEEFTNVDNIIKRIKDNKDIFDRPRDSIIKIPVSQNTYLPPEYDKYLSEFTENLY